MRGVVLSALRLIVDLNVLVSPGVVSSITGDVSHSVTVESNTGLEEIPGRWYMDLGVTSIRTNRDLGVVIVRVDLGVDLDTRCFD